MLPSPTSIQVSIVSQSVTVHHPKELSSAVVQSALGDAGFDVLTNPSPSEDHGTDSISGALSEFLANKRKKHVQQCSLCREEELHSDFDSKLSLDRHVSSDVFRSDANISRLDVAEERSVDMVVETDRRLSIASSIGTPGPFRVTLSVDGMTCSSCSGTITKTISDLQGVSEVAVSLLSKSATVIVDHKKLAEVVAGAIEDCGFLAEVLNVAPLDALSQDSTSGPRTVALRIDGMFCQ